MLCVNEYDIPIPFRMDWIAASKNIVQVKLLIIRGYGGRKWDHNGAIVENNYLAWVAAFIDGNNTWAVKLRIGAPIVLAQISSRLVSFCSRIHYSTCRWTSCVMPQSVKVTYFMNQNFA